MSRDALGDGDSVDVSVAHEKTDIRTSFPRFMPWAGSAGAHDTNSYLTPTLSDVVQTSQNNDRFMWAGNQTPSVNRRSAGSSTPADGFDF